MPLFFKHQRAMPRMPWGVVGAIGGTVVNNVMADGKGGSGGSSQQSSSEPWAMAQPWMMSNIVSGMNLQNQLTASPFSPQQQAAYDNSYALNDYMRNLVPSLLGQIGGQQVGFDPKNPSARPQAWNWAGLLSEGDPNLGQRSVLNAKPPSTAADTAPKQSGTFTQQGDVLNGMNRTGQNADGSLIGAGGYGSFKYGMPMPQPGTQAYRDMSEYFANGGADPNDIYGRKASAYQLQPANPLSYLWTSGGGPGMVAGGGIGDTGANAAAAASGNTAW
ncbi:hypothetical protein ABL840_05065 [Variovorax sp. NFACC27]|uniref:hypothetical protein n=1 Tax=unclassified Variovorax TaxID=663243 RepID=UPI00089C27F1|nr:hypothetical protein SAMN03159371_00146 [Variovorax sp. NFACC28]SEF71484.1 hypothetical protein SAMN03159365_00672 [Variovorax sp. NFACC29]SFB76842.1 hypothetical protein SAMN03159379_00671 [Variovorax sp. NFACC26]SFG76475.1 hypothetical protein SAMN03159447_04794 [Variovorax sp. NFACC27]